MHVPAKSKTNLKIIVLIVALLAVGAAVNALIRVGNNQGYAPEQPIPFSHKLHAGQNNIPCMYCHAGVEKSKHATVPAVNVCMNCHSVVKPDSPHIKKLKEYYEQGKEIPWVKVNDLPDHVNFNHKRHIAKGVACETCHGDVKKMAVVRQDKPLLMGWCLDCHRGETSPTHLVKAPAGQPEGSAIAAGQVAPTSCYTCHH
ncbi:MAG: cytochrome c3 family protein [Bdellovibrionota bacterium]